MVKTVITAPRGAMAGLIVEEAWKHPEIELVGCVGNPSSDYIGKDVVRVVPAIGQETGVKVCGDIEDCIDKCDIVIDFSTVALSMKVLAACKAHGKALLCGTTGFSEEQNSAFQEAGSLIPIMKSANTSYVVNVMKLLLAKAAAMLGDKCKIEIIEAHVETKLDKPSGTALELAEVMADAASDKTMDDITFHSVRAGNTPSSHHVLFGCRGEILQITHDAYDSRCFAIGACDAAAFLGGKKPGCYAMSDVAEALVEKA